MAPPARPTREHASQPSNTSTSLLERAKSRDADAWNRLIELYGPLVYWQCRNKHIAPPDAADVVQEVFRAVDRKLSEFRRERPGDSFRAWLSTITKNKINDHFRRQARNPAAPVGGSDMQAQIHLAPDHAPESSLDGGQFDARTDLVQRALRLVQGDFAEKTWRAFWRVTVEGQPTDMVAQALGMSKASVHQAKSRVLSRLRQELQGLGE
jgi:RNA polymerase sigma-70 factor (ECF subfamily)